MNVRRKMLGDILVENNLITEEQLHEALVHQRETGERLGKTLLKLGFITEEMFIHTLEFQLGIPSVKLFQYDFPKELIAIVPEALARTYKTIPVKLNNGRVLVAMADPLNLAAIQDLQMATGLEIDAAIASEEEIDRYLERLYGLPGDIDIAFQEMAATEIINAGFFDLDKIDSLDDEGPVVRAVNTIIQQSVRERASDIHIEPQENNLKVRIRVDGVLREILTLPKNVQASLISRMKIMAEMDIAEKRIPQDGRIHIKTSAKEIDLRVSTLPTIYGEKIVTRILDKSNSFLSIKQLGFSQKSMEKFRNLVQNPYGMVLITGPTGSGKTTTLYAGLNEIDRLDKNVVTVEDPVEYVLDNCSQVQVNTKAGLTFATGLRSILRQDPDVIMIGEIRDVETAAIGVRAATTGHLVLSTLHTNDASGALTRLLDMGVEPFLVSSSIIGIIGQRLARKICPHCKERYVLPQKSPERIFLGLGHEEEVFLYKGKGCTYCGKTGYRGRVALQEVLTVTSEIRNLVIQRTSSKQIKDVALAQGMIPIKDDGIYKVMAGITTVEEIKRVAFTEEW